MKKELLIIVYKINVQGLSRHQAQQQLHVFINHYNLSNDEELKKGVLTIFHEIQSQYMKNPGFRPDGIPNFFILPVAFINRLIVFFPFLAKEKRF